MATQRKIIITCAVTGPIHTPSMSPHLPVTPEEIIAASVEAAEAASHPVDGAHSISLPGTVTSAPKGKAPTVSN